MRCKTYPSGPVLVGPRDDIRTPRVLNKSGDVDDHRIDRPNYRQHNRGDDEDQSYEDSVCAFLLLFLSWKWDNRMVQK